MAEENNDNTNYLSRAYTNLGNLISTKLGEKIGKEIKSKVSLGNTVAELVGKEKEYQDFIGDVTATGELYTNAGSGNSFLDNYKLAQSRDNKNLDIYQYGYLLPKDEYYKLLEDEGYKKIEPEGENPYGLVTKAVGNKKVPIFQEHEDDIERDKVVPVTNINFTREMVADDPSYFSVGLKRARNYPSTVFVDPTSGEIYYQGWDYHNYGIDTNQSNNKKGSTANNYSFKNKLLSSILDVAGNPIVRKSGIRHINDSDFEFLLNNMSAKQLHELSKNSSLGEKYKSNIEKKKINKEDEYYNLYLQQFKESDDYIEKLQTMDEEELEKELQQEYPKVNLKQYITEMQHKGNANIEILPWL